MASVAYDVEMRLDQGLRTIKGTARHGAVYAGKMEQALRVIGRAREKIDKGIENGEVDVVHTNVKRVLTAFATLQDNSVDLWKTEQAIVNWILKREQKEVDQVAAVKKTLSHIDNLKIDDQVKKERLKKNLAEGIANLEKVLHDAASKIYSELKYLKSSGRDVLMGREDILAKLRSMKLASSKDLARKEWYLAWRERFALGAFKTTVNSLEKDLNTIDKSVRSNNVQVLEKVAKILSNKGVVNKFKSRLVSVLSLIHEIHRDMTLIQIRTQDDFKDLWKKIQSLRPEGYPADKWRELATSAQATKKHVDASINHMWMRTRYLSRSGAKVKKRA